VARWLGWTSKAGRGIAVTVASGKSWGSALGLDIQLDITNVTPWRRPASLRVTLLRSFGQS